MKSLSKIFLITIIVFMFTLLVNLKIYSQSTDVTGTASHNLGILRWDTETTPLWNSYRMYYPNGQYHNEIHRRRNYQQMMLDYVETEGAAPKNQVEKTWGRTGSYGFQHDYKLKNTPPSIIVDGVTLSPAFEGEVDANIKSDIEFTQGLVFWDYTGGFITETSYSYANQYHNSYIIFDINYEFQLENIASGSVLPEQTLNMYFLNHWTPEGMGRGIRTYGPGGWGNICRSFVTGDIFPSALKAAGKITNSVFLRDSFTVSYDMSDDIKSFYLPRSLYGDEWVGTYPEFDDRGLPVGNETGPVNGEFTNWVSTGFATLHADKSATDRTDDVTKPHRLWHIKLWTGDPDSTNLVESGIDPHPWDQGYEDPIAQLGSGGRSHIQYQFHGPYELQPEQDVSYVHVYAVGGFSQDIAWEKGNEYMEWYRDGTGDFDDVKMNELMDTCMDSLIQNIDRAYWAYSRNYDIPDPLGAPDIEVTSGAERIKIEWGYSDVNMYKDPDTGVDDFYRWKLYRKEGAYLVNDENDGGNHYDYELIGIFSKNTTAYIDANILLGTNYHYCVTALDDGSQNTDGLFPGQKLESSFYSNRTLIGACASGIYLSLSTVADQKVNVPFKIAVTPNWLVDTLTVLIGCNFNAVYPEGPQLFTPSVSDTFTITADEAKNDAVISFYKASDYTLLGQSNIFNIISLTSADIAPPSNLSAVDNPNDAGGYIKLSFTASANHPGYTSLSGYDGDNIPIDYYQVYRNSSDTSFANSINWAVIPATPKAPGQSNTITSVISTKGDESSNAYYWAAAVKGELPPSVTESVSKASAGSKTNSYLLEAGTIPANTSAVSEITAHNRAIGAKNNSALTADFDSDRKVGLRDFAVLNWAYDNPAEYDRLFDLNLDGSINAADFKIFENQFGESTSNNDIAYQSGSNGNSTFELVNEYDPDNKLISLQIKGSNITSLAGYSFKLKYNPNIYEFVSVNDGGFLESSDDTAPYFLAHVNKQGNAVVSNILEGTDRCPAGEGMIAIFTFRHIGSQIEPVTIEEIEIIDKNYKLNSLDKISLEYLVPLPAQFALKNNYPNPFNPVTNIRYELPKASLVTLKVYNKLGQTVRTLVNEEKTAGYYSVQWDGENDSGVKVSSGIYFYSIVTNAGYVKVKKMVFLK